jgi:hypothetical protein
MQERPTRHDILARLQTEYDRLLATVARLTPEQMTTPGVTGTWSVKEILAHLIFWNMVAVRGVEAAQRGETLPHNRRGPDWINAGAVAHYRDRSVDEVISDFKRSFLEVTRTLENLPNSVFEPGSPVEVALKDSIAGTFDNNTTDHYALHEAEIRAWLNGAG